MVSEREGQQDKCMIRGAGGLHRGDRRQDALTSVRPSDAAVSLQGDWSRSFCEPRQWFDNSDMCERGLMRLKGSSQQRLARIHVGGHGPHRDGFTARRGGSHTGLGQLYMRDSARGVLRPNEPGCRRGKKHTAIRDAVSAHFVVVAVVEHQQTGAWHPE